VDPRFLDLAEVLEIHVDQIERYGGTVGVRDLPLLLSALAMPTAGVRGVYVHGTLFEIAGAYLFHIAKNHPFVDGNKRTALASTLTFLDLNGLSVEGSTDELVALVEGVVAGRATKSDVARWLRDHHSP
jgi:death-on-curing protein